MTIESFLAPQRCIILKRQEKQEVIGELVAALWRAVPDLDYSTIFNAIWEREVQFTTRISAEIAMPHAQIHGMESTFICAGLSPEGITYDPKDQTLVKLVFLVVGPPEDHLKVLSTLAKFLSVDQVVEDLMECTTGHGLYEVLTRGSTEGSTGDPIPIKPPLEEPSTEAGKTDGDFSVQEHATLLGLSEQDFAGFEYALSQTKVKPQQDRIILEASLQVALSLKAAQLFVHTRNSTEIIRWFSQVRRFEGRDVRDFPPDYIDDPHQEDIDFPGLVIVEPTTTFLIDESPVQEESWIQHLFLPYRQTKTNPVSMSLLIALSRGMIHKGQKVVSVFQTAEEEYNALEVTDLDKDFGVFFSMPFHDSSVDTQMEVFMRVLQIATELAAEGREGKPVGTMFVLGDSDQVARHSQQMVVNPFRGYDESERNILDPSLSETLKEFSRIDGAIVIKGNGVVVSAGTYLRVDRPVEPLPAGLGARHTAAAGITSVSQAISLAISESTRQVSIFYGGSRVMVL